MKLLFAVLAVVLVSCHGSRVIISGVKPLSKEMTRVINALNTTWTAHDDNFDEKFDVKKLKDLLGVHPLYHTNPLNKLPVQEIPFDSAALPESFDARQKWPDCPSIKEVRDQGSCGSCWAFGAVEAMSDRVCIASKGKIKADISAEDLVSCCGLFNWPPCGFGCKGGFPSGAWSFWKSSGLVTGGLYNGTGCRPYSIPPCSHHTKSPLPDCSKDLAETPKCTKECNKGYAKEYSNDKVFASKVYKVSGVEQIMTEIMNNGPVEADYQVYADFPNYKSGVYQRHSEEHLGGHAIKIIGWGKENGVDYWLCTNSWNKYWGDQGYFKIRRGTNECDIENDINAGIPAL